MEVNIVTWESPCKPHLSQSLFNLKPNCLCKDTDNFQYQRKFDNFPKNFPVLPLEQFQHFSDWQLLYIEPQLFHTLLVNVTEGVMCLARHTAAVVFHFLPVVFRHFGWLQRLSSHISTSNCHIFLQNRLKGSASCVYLQVFWFASSLVMHGAMSLQLALTGKFWDAADRSFDIAQELHTPVQEQHTAITAQLHVCLSQTHQTLHDLKCWECLFFKPSGPEKKWQSWKSGTCMWASTGCTGSLGSAPLWGSRQLHWQFRASTMIRVPGAQYPPPPKAHNFWVIITDCYCTTHARPYFTDTQHGFDTALLSAVANTVFHTGLRQICAPWKHVVFLFCLQRTCADFTSDWLAGWLVSHQDSPSVVLGWMVIH